MKIVSIVVVFPILLLVPVADELIGKQQFETLCKRYAVQVVDAPSAMNAHVISVGGSSERNAEGTAIPVRVQPWIYKDTTTGKVVVSYHTLHAEGGWLIRTLGISSTNSPLLFSRSCAPLDERSFIKTFNITIVN